MNVLDKNIKNIFSLKEEKLYKEILNDINKLAGNIHKEVNIMEVCGSHTKTACDYNLRSLLPDNINLITGPGCPVCVTDQYDIDCIIEIAKAKIPIATYFDMLKVPGNNTTLEKIGQKFNNIFGVASVNEVIELKKKYKNILFFGIGFETTAPMTTILINHYIDIYSTHKFFIPALFTILKDKKINIDGFIGPGHVSAITGIKPYLKLKVPFVICGFEAFDMLLGIRDILKQLINGNYNIKNNYNYVVKQEGNIKAQNSIITIFEPKDAYWRGFGIIKESGMELRKKYNKLNAKLKYKKIIDKVDEKLARKQNKGCACDKIIKGYAKPNDCPFLKQNVHTKTPLVHVWFQMKEHVLML